MLNDSSGPKALSTQVDNRRGPLLPPPREAGAISIAGLSRLGRPRSADYALVPPSPAFPGSADRPPTTNAPQKWPCLYL